MKVGDQSKTDVVLMYIEDIADPQVVSEVKHRIEQVKVDGLTMTDKELEEFITNQVYNPFPLVRYTERPDVVAAHLYQGMVAIVVDTSPSVMLGPVTLFDHLTSVEEYRQTPAVGTFLRLIRYGRDYCFNLLNANMVVICLTSRVFTRLFTSSDRKKKEIFTCSSSNLG